MQLIEIIGSQTVRIALLEQQLQLTTQENVQLKAKLAKYEPNAKTPAPTAGPQLVPDATAPAATEGASTTDAPASDAPGPGPADN